MLRATLIFVLAALAVAAPQANAQTLRERITFEVNRGAWKLAFSPDGQTLAVAGDDTVRLFDGKTGKKTRSFNDELTTFHAVAFSPDGAQVAVAGGRRSEMVEMGGGVVKVWNVAKGEEVLTWRWPVKNKLGGFWSVAFSPKGDLLLAGGREVSQSGSGMSGVVYLIDPAKGKQVNAFRETGGWGLTGAFTPNGKSVVAAGWEGVSLFEVESGRQQKPWPALKWSNRGYPPPLGVSSDGKLIATAGRVDLKPGPDVVMLYDYPDGKGPRLLKVRGRVALALSPSGQMVATGESDGKLKLWDSATGRLLAAYELDAKGISALAFSPDGQTLAACTGMTVRLWDVIAPKKEEKFDPLFLGPAELLLEKYLRDKGVRAELRLKDAARKDLEGLSGEYRKGANDLAGKDFAAEEQRKDAWHELDAHFNKKLCAVLGPGQQKRLRQIHLQAIHALAWEDEQVRKELGLSPEQAAKVLQIVADTRKQADATAERALREGAGQSPDLRPIYAEGARRIEAVLTDDQRVGWEVMLGRPFTPR